jgi:L-fuconolactonase
VVTVVDAHHHFLYPSRRSYPWLTDELAAIRRRFGVDELRPLLAEAGVDATVVVQTVPDLDETRELLRTAAVVDVVGGVVGWVDLTDPALPDVLDEVRAGPGGSYLVGVRHQVHDEADERWLLRPDVLRGLQGVADAGLAYDLLVRPRELPAAVQVARRFEGLRFVLDHIGKPRIALGEDAEWAAAMAGFALLANVSCKLSGMVTEADRARWRPEDLAPFVASVREWFGDERLLFGSDWPVCLVAASYSQVKDAVLAALGPVPGAARDAIMGGNAVRVYGLGVS